MLTNTSLPNPLLSHLLHMVTHLFKDNVSWPLGSSRFYLGLIPPLLMVTESNRNRLAGLATNQFRLLFVATSSRP